MFEILLTEGLMEVFMEVFMEVLDNGKIKLPSKIPIPELFVLLTVVLKFMVVLAMLVVAFPELFVEIL